MSTLSSMIAKFDHENLEESQYGNRTITSPLEQLPPENHLWTLNPGQ